MAAGIGAQPAKPREVNGMGIYVNPDNRGFRLAVNDDIYIDKTELIRYTNSRLGKAGCYLCVSRPRRFGKTMAADGTG